MEGQTVLTNYFTAGKSRQNGHPAKRRKVATGIDGVPCKSAKLLAEKVVYSRQENASLNSSHALLSRASSKGRQVNSSRNRNGKAKRRAATQKAVSDSVVSVTTSSKDDHRGRRERKQNSFGLSASQIIQLATSTPASLKEAKPIENVSLEAGKDESCAADVPKIGTNGKNTIALEERAKHKTIGLNLGNNAPKPDNISSQPKIGLKINSWIAEQAKLVLSSRGKQALEKSLGRNVSSVSFSRPVKEDVLVETKLVSKPPKSPRLQANAKVTIPRLSQGATSAGPTAKCVTTESGSNLPAYKRFSHLLEAKKPKRVGVTQSLPLPYHFKALEEMFRCIDVVLSLKQKRYETCTFDKLKDAVQEMCRKKFEMKHLAQIKAVYPTAFIFRQQSNFSGPKKSNYQLTIDFNFDGSGGPKRDDFKFIESSTLIARQKQFKNMLMKRTMEHHRAYLGKNYPSLSINDDEIMRWHPCFPLDEVPEIEQSSLPECPQVKTFMTAKDVLNQARKNTTSRVQEALNNVANISSETNIANSDQKSNENKKDTDQTNNQSPALKGVSQSLIEKIRKKEQKKIEESLTTDPEVVQKRVMVQRLPELCRILKTYFVSERKAAIPLEDVNNKLAESYTNTLSSVQIDKHVKLLSEVVPEWLSIMYVRKCPYVKLKKNVNIKVLTEKLKSSEVN